MKEIESDVVVIGGGIAGCVAAITAHDNGATALVLEKMPDPGGNCPITMGNILTPTKMEFVDYLETLSFKTTEREVLGTFVKVALNNAEWIRKMGGEVIEYHPLGATYPLVERGPGFPQVKHAEHMVKYNVKGSRGEGSGGQRLWNLVKRNLEQRSIGIMTHTNVKEILKNENMFAGDQNDWASYDPDREIHMMNENLSREYLDTFRYRAAATIMRKK